MRPATRLLNVLIVDPDQQYREILAQILAPRCAVSYAETLAQAASYLAEQQLNVIIIERDLPDGDGLRFVQQVRSDARMQNVSIACVTHRSEVRDKIAGFRAGVDDYVIKPVDPEIFLQRILLLMRVRRLTS